MSPQERRIQELEKQVKQLTDFMKSFENVGQVPPLVAATIKKLSVTLNLADLQDVSSTAPSSGQVLKYNGTVWAPGTDNV